jgi:hypothetical protein
MPTPFLIFPISQASGNTLPISVPFWFVEKLSSAKSSLEEVSSFPKPLECHTPSWSSALYSIVTMSYLYRKPSFNKLAQISDVCCVPTYDANPIGAIPNSYTRLAEKAAHGKLGFSGRNGSGILSSVRFRRIRGYVSVDCSPKSKELDVFVVAIGMESMDKLEFTDKPLSFLLLSSDGDT